MRKRLSLLALFLWTQTAFAQADVEAVRRFATAYMPANPQPVEVHPTANGTTPGGRYQVFAAVRGDVKNGQGEVLTLVVDPQAGTVNAGFALGIASFFTGAGAIGLTVGAIIFGASNAGGEIAWSLWVTKFAPAERVAEYMSVHTFFTGIRGIFAPILAFQLTQTLDIGAIALVCAGFIMLASLILVPEIGGQKGAAHTAGRNTGA